MGSTGSVEERIARRMAKAAELSAAGCNCSQSVLGAYADELGIEFETAYRMATGLGGGVGGMRQACGAFTAAALVIGNFCTDDFSGEGHDNATRTAAKNRTYEIVQEAAEVFRAHLAETFDASHASLVCAEILQGKKPPELPCSRVREAGIIAVETIRERLLARG